jgi:class 3 adenylate cyclase
VAINRIPEDQRIAATQLGKTMHLAVWLQYLASPGTLLISATTMQQVPDVGRCVVARTVTIPGQSQPFRVYVMADQTIP